MIASFEGKKPEIAEGAYIAPGVVMIGEVRIAAEASIWFQSVLRGDINSIEIGEKTNIQDGCLLHVTKRHALKVGARVTVGHGAILHACEIGDDCLIAMGAIVLDGAVVEAGSMVGAGALVPPGMRVKAGSLVLGSPAKFIRELNTEDQARIQAGWQNYIDYSRRFAAEIKS
ncbi:MAG: gamma carbonic anhydrase family protein [Candidatus Obscuribacterales bacterium]|nr:gamma carbonic anhydrase family protein [Candidatus Obscuribacterales bacterium]